MDAANIVALSTAGVSAVVAIRTAAWTRVVQREAASAARELEVLKANLRDQNDEAKRRIAESSLRARYRDPLLLAADELRHRLGNIQDSGFLVYLDTARRDTALQTTLYRFARYFGIIEIIGLDVAVLRLADPANTDRAARAMAEIGRAFASDAYDQTGAGFKSSQFMIWREEQRAMGESCIDIVNGQRQLVGYSTFVLRLRDDDTTWFQRLESDLLGGDAQQSERFHRLRTLLGELTQCLHEDDAVLPSSSTRSTS